MSIVSVGLSIAQAQSPPCAPAVISPVYLVPHLYSPPAVDPTMPPDVQIGYFAAGLAYASTNSDSLMRLYSRQVTFNDTVKKSMRFFYQMVDHDPFRFAQFLLLPRPTDSSVSLPWIHMSLLNLVKSTSPTPALDFELMRASIIMRIQCSSTVEDTLLRVGFTPRYNTTVYSTVVDTIKGRRLPACQQETRVAPRRRVLPTQMTLASYLANQFDTVATDAASIGHCLRFHYASGWGVHEGVGAKWIKPTQQYVVFLNLVEVCSDEYGTYFGLRPVGSATPTFRLFPVTQDTVRMPGDELGVGSEAMHVSDFTSLLRSRIATIKQY